MELLRRPKLAWRSLGRRWPSVSPENIEAEMAAGEGKLKQSREREEPLAGF